MPAKPLFGPALPSRSFRRILCFSGSNWPTLGVVPAPISFPLNFGKAAEHPVINPETGFGRSRATATKPTPRMQNYMVSQPRAHSARRRWQLQFARAEKLSVALAFLGKVMPARLANAWANIREHGHCRLRFSESLILQT